MRKLLMVASLLVVSAAYADNVYENPMDGDAGGWLCTASVVTEGDRTFTRGHEFVDPWWYVNTYAGGEVDCSTGVTVEADIRWHQEGSTPYLNAWVGLRLGTPGYGEVFIDPFFQVGLVPPGSVGDTWYHVSYTLTPEDKVILEHFDGFEFYGTIDDDAWDLDYVDFDNFVITPEPSALFLLGLGFVTVLRRR